MNRPETQDKGYSKYTSQKLPSGSRHSNSQRGISRIIKANKRAEAEARNAASPNYRRRTHWTLAGCPCGRRMHGLSTPTRHA